MKRGDRQLLGKFNKDVLFLEKFISTTSVNNSVNDEFKNVCNSVVRSKQTKWLWMLSSSWRAGRIFGSKQPRLANVLFKKNIRFFSILHSRLCPCLFLKSVSGWFIAANNVKCKTLKVVKIKSKGEIGRLKVFEYLGCYYLCASIFTSTSRLCSRVALTDWTGLRTAALTLMDGSGLIFILVVSNVMPILMEFKKLLIRGHYDTYRVCFVVTSHVFRDFFEYSFTRRHLKRLVGWWREGCKRWP